MVPIKALILAAGYATRLYPIGEHTPKPLLEVGGKSILHHIVGKLQKVKNVSDVYIVTNHRFYHQFRVWLNHHNPMKEPQKITLINDGTFNNDDRLGAVGDINFVLKEKEMNDDLLVIAGDNLFGFSLQKFIDFFKEKGKSIVALKDLGDTEKIKKQYGAALIESGSTEEASRLIHFEEKPPAPKSTLAATACYCFRREDLPLVEKSVELGKADNPGDLIKFLIRESEVHGFVFREHWYDVGSPESLQEAENAYSR